MHYVQADIGHPKHRARLLADVERVVGMPSALVNNAGRASRVRANLLEATEDSFDEVLRTNLHGPYFLTQALARGMIAAGVGGHRRRGVVFITSVSAEMASPERGEYCVSKAGLAMAVKLFALRLAAHAIPVYEVRPGVIATDMTAPVEDKYRPPYCRGLDSRGPLGGARRRGTDGRGAPPWGRALRNRHGAARRRRPRNTSPLGASVARR